MDQKYPDYNLERDLDRKILFCVNYLDHDLDNFNSDIG